MPGAAHSYRGLASGFEEKNEVSSAYLPDYSLEAAPDEYRNFGVAQIVDKSVAEKVHWGHLAGDAVWCCVHKSEVWRCVEKNV
jgi:hypothetical protein